MEIKLDDRFRLTTNHECSNNSEPVLVDDEGQAFAPDEEVPPSYEIACDIVEQYLSWLYDNFSGGLISSEDYGVARTFILRGHGFDPKKNLELQKKERKQDSMRQRKTAREEAEKLTAGKKRRQARLRMIIANVIFVALIIFLALLMLLT